MSSSPKSDRPFDQSLEENRRKERELAEAQGKSTRRERMVNRLRILQMISSLVALATGNPTYRWVAKCAQWAMDRFWDSE
ncbi:hypothetical protein [Streptomyces bauhiniae]|uniref:hypothetical protein n=1 Tax=Streptomyces bauhiniae TaxID=2340725 RepID=UPI003455605C